nr:MAG TPA: hypothetical protein [Caudoviricetes sp.]
MGLYQKYQAYVNQLESMKKIEDEEVKKIATSDKTLMSLLNITEMNLNLFKIIKSQKLDEDVIAEYLYKKEVNLGIHSCITYILSKKGFNHLDELLNYLCDGSVHTCLNQAKPRNLTIESNPRFEVGIENPDYTILIDQIYDGYFDIARGTMYVKCDELMWVFCYEM